MRWVYIFIYSLPLIGLQKNCRFRLNKLARDFQYILSEATLFFTLSLSGPALGGAGPNILRVLNETEIDYSLAPDPLGSNWSNWLKAGPATNQDKVNCKGLQNYKWRVKNTKEHSKWTIRQKFLLIQMGIPLA